MPGRAAARRERQRERGRADQEGREMLAKQFRGFRFCRVEPMTSRSPVFAPIFSTHAHPRGDVTAHTHTHVRLAGAMLRDALRRGASRDWASGFKAQDPLLMGMGRRNCMGGGDVYKTEASLERLFIDLQLVWRTWKSHPRWVRSTRFASYSRGLSVGSWDPVGTVGIVRNDETC